MRKILLIEDDAELSSLLALQFTQRGYDIDVVHNGKRGLQSALSQHYDSIILDLHLPGLDGIEILREIRRKELLTPVIILSQRGSETERVLGLELGADDFLPKPFSLQELFARVNAILRRAQRASSDRELENNGALLRGLLKIEEQTRRVSLNGSPLQLTAKEFDLLLFLAKRPGRVFSKSDLLKHIWGYTTRHYEHTVSSHVNRLRAKIEADPKSPLFIQTVWAVGYRFAELSELKDQSDPSSEAA